MCFCEFLMKDVYFFYIFQEFLQEIYDVMYVVYSKIFSCMGLDFCVVQVDIGFIGGSVFYEFQVLVQSGEDDVVFFDIFDYVVNIELVEVIVLKELCVVVIQEMMLVDMLNVKIIVELVEQFNLLIEKMVKILLVKVVEGSSFLLVVLLVCGDYELNEVKVEKLLQVVSLLIFVIEEEICVVVKVGLGLLGLVNMLILVVIDCIVVVMSDFVVGVNIDGKYYFGINWDCDVVILEVVDICNVVVGDLSLDGQGMLLIKCGIEVGYIFQLGIKYFEVLKVFVQGEDGCN